MTGFIGSCDMLNHFKCAGLMCVVVLKKPRTSFFFLFLLLLKLSDQPVFFVVKT